MTIAVDFDGTIVEHKFPDIGKEKPFAIETLRKLASEGHRLILWTAREGELLDKAVEYCKERGLVFFAINSDTPTGGLVFASKSSTTKLVADVYIDDRNIGGLPDWGTIYDIINGTRTYYRSKHRRKRSFLKRLFGK